MLSNEAKEKEVLELLEEFAHCLRSNVRRNISELAIAGEWGIALEELTNMLNENDIPVPRRHLERIQSLCREMGMSDSCWSMLCHLVVPA